MSGREVKFPVPPARLTVRTAPIRCVGRKLIFLIFSPFFDIFPEVLCPQGKETTRLTVIFPLLRASPLMPEPPAYKVTGTLGVVHPPVYPCPPSYSTQASIERALSALLYAINGCTHSLQHTKLQAHYALFFPLYTQASIERVLSALLYSINGCTHSLQHTKLQAH
ncbi:hypothetical protein J6590_077462 [Homalodisca vitripennis]|nr:hypothetical protein J6590_077462 [Homalodisca vitripennis]